mmetsp:Transcript_1042/g.1579  ORF Transcript_1042/g.1579 Transcript_1042/m.1579 type:complete len:219 (+) Transcript_1042:64-720(+)
MATENQKAATKYLKGIDVALLSKSERRKLTKIEKRRLKAPQKPRKKRSLNLSREERKERFQSLASNSRTGGISKTPQNPPKREKRFCLGCREPGHFVKNCPKSSAAQTRHVCYKCGSTEHTLVNCQKKQGLQLKYAVCFVCKKEGHISSKCPLNKKGIYPDGGSCMICDSIYHLADDCPENKKVDDEGVGTFDNDGENAPVSVKNVVQTKSRKIVFKE